MVGLLLYYFTPIGNILALNPFSYKFFIRANDVCPKLKLFKGKLQARSIIVDLLLLPLLA